LNSRLTPVVGWNSQRQATPVTMPDTANGKTTHRAEERLALDPLIQQHRDQKADQDALRHEPAA
jgi:hypothetical protein